MRGRPLRQACLLFPRQILGVWCDARTWALHALMSLRSDSFCGISLSLLSLAHSLGR